MADTVTRYGRIDILVNNAGIGGGSRLAETSTQAFDTVMNVNLRGTFFCCRAGFRHMKQQGGGVIDDRCLRNPDRGLLGERLDDEGEGEPPRAAARVLRVTGEAVRVGITTDALDELAHAETIRLGGYPSPLNYRGFPKAICTSVNEVICHGIPDSRPLEDGDIVNLDVTVYLDGMHGDCSATFLVGEVDAGGRKLVQVARECLARGIAAVRPGRPVSDIGKAIEALASRHGYGVVRAYCGHGIGETFHTSLQVPHHYDPSVRRTMEPGMTFTVEPMITEGTWQDLLWDDGWTAVTADGERSAQFEHTLVVTPDGAEILTVE